jgi:hypothetical protein
MIKFQCSLYCCRIHLHIQTSSVESDTFCMHLVPELTENGTVLPKHVGIMKDHNFKCVCNLCIKVVLQVNIMQKA